MSERNSKLLLEDILEAITNIQEFTKNISSYSDFLSDLMLSQAVFFNFTIIGEAVAQIPENFKNLHPQVDWRIIKDMRNYIVHEYFGIKPKVIWDTIQFELQDLKSQIQNILDNKNYE